MAATKRRPSFEAVEGSHDRLHRNAGRAFTKRPRLEAYIAPPLSRDIVSTLSDELLVRIFSYLDERDFVAISPVSKRFYALAADSQLWRALYYRRFVLPHSHHHLPSLQPRGSSPAVAQPPQPRSPSADDGARPSRPPPSLVDPSDPSSNFIEDVDWKRHYKLRHNWARGQCAVQEVQVSDLGGSLRPDKQTLIRVADGLAITADLRHGMRAWDLHTGATIAHTYIETHDGAFLNPTAIALDAQRLSLGNLDIILGFEDGTFGVWRIHLDAGTIELLYRQERSFVGTLVSVAYCHPYVMTAAELGFVSIYSFSPTSGVPRDDSLDGDDASLEPARPGEDDARVEVSEDGMTLREPHLVTQLKSHYSRVPLALSIRRAAGSTIASIAYTFSALGGWSIGVQDFDIRPSGNHSRDVVTSRVAYTSPTESCPTLAHRKSHGPGCRYGYDCENEGPNKLLYGHPYLLATMPDNTLIMHRCTASEDSFEISRGVRLWGHTSAISDADITPRGKAVSISLQGNELRVWELGVQATRPSVEVRPRHQGQTQDDEGFYERSTGSTPVALDLEDRTSWVGFDKEMIVVLKVGLNGRENMVVYDFS